jgi:hypothetical protein
MSEFHMADLADLPNDFHTKCMLWSILHAWDKSKASAPPWGIKEKETDKLTRRFPHPDWQGDILSDS